MAKQYVIRSLNYDKNYRSTVIRDAHTQEYESTKKMVNEWHRKGYIIDEHLAGYLDEAIENEGESVEHGGDDPSDCEDDDESCFHDERTSLFNRYKLATILIEYEFLQKNYE